MISIVIPTYNEEKYLPALLRDIKTQTLQPDQIIVADAHSRDHTRAIAQKYGCKVVDGGLPGAGRNRGAAAVGSGIIIFFDADGRLPSSRFLEDNLAEFRKRRLDVATCDITPYEGTILDFFMLHTYNIYARILENVKAHAPGICIIVKKRIHDAINGFDETVKLAEDMEYVQRATRVGTFGILRSHPIATSTRRFQKDGHFKTIIKYLLAELYMRTLGGVRSNIFKYEFGYPSNRTLTQSSDLAKRRRKKLMRNRNV